MINRLKPTTQSRVSAERETSEFSFSSTCRFPSQLSHRLHPWVGKIPWKRKWQSTPVFFPGKSHGQRSLAGYSLWGCIESDTTERLTHTQIVLPQSSSVDEAVLASAAFLNAA